MELRYLSSPGRERKSVFDSEHGEKRKEDSDLFRRINKINKRLDEREKRTEHLSVHCFLVWRWPASSLSRTHSSRYLRMSFPPPLLLPSAFFSLSICCTQRWFHVWLAERFFRFIGLVVLNHGFTSTPAGELLSTEADED